MNNEETGRKQFECPLNSIHHHLEREKQRVYEETMNYPRPSTAGKE